MAQGQIIIRRKKTNETRIQNNIIWDENISTMARFSLIAMLSMREGWDYSVQGHGLHAPRFQGHHVQVHPGAGRGRVPQANADTGRERPVRQSNLCADGCPLGFWRGTVSENYDTEPCPNFSAPEKPAPKKSPQQKRNNKQQNGKEKIYPLKPPKPPCTYGTAWSPLWGMIRSTRPLLRDSWRTGRR